MKLEQPKRKKNLDLLSFKPKDSIKISFAMQKGGVGKTTTVRNLGSHLALLGYKVLLIDTDPQGNCTTSCVNQFALAESGQPTLYDVFVNATPLKDTLIEVENNLYLAPALINLASVELSIASEMARELFLKSAIDEMNGDFDFILFDCPPSLSLLTVNALVASDYVIYVTQLDFFILQGLEQLRETVTKAKRLNSKLSEIGVIETMDDNTNHTSDISEAIEAIDLLKLGKVDRATAVRDAIMYKKALKDYDPSHKIVEQYNTITSNLLHSIKGEKKNV